MARGFASIALAATLAASSQSVRVERLDGSLTNPFDWPSGTKAAAFVFVSTECPISNRYAPEIRRLVDAFAPKGVVFRLVYPNPADTADAIRHHLTGFDFGGVDPLRDPTQALVRFTGATVTPEAAVVMGGRVVYRGRIDDRYAALGVDRQTAATHDLEDALSAALAGRPAAHRTTQAVGCFIADFAR